MSPESPKPTTRLPNAPLTEVVFELRWRLDGSESIPIPFRNDPGYHVMADRFGTAASEHGFSYPRKAQEEPTPFAQAPPYSIDWRFHERQDQPFPLWQIGPGVFAANDSASYEWNSFKKLCLQGARLLVHCYPKLRNFRWEPFHLELRYLDSFSLGTKADEDLVGFLNHNTSLSLTLPQLVSGRLTGLTNGQLVLNYAVKGMGETLFVIVIGSGVSQGVKSVIMQSKVVTNLGKLKTGRGQFVSELNQWLENAHDITSPFFKEFIKEHLMKKFTGS